MSYKILDLFCGAGGAGKGYQDAGFVVYGVDIEPQPDYPGAFIQGDALAYLAAHGHEYDAVHASPPCQASSALSKGTNKGNYYLNLIPATRALLALHNVPTVIENVQGSDLRRDLTLCGEMFGLGVIRHRYFETSGFTALPLDHKPHRGRVAGWTTYQRPASRWVQYMNPTRSIEARSGQIQAHYKLINQQCAAIKESCRRKGCIGTKEAA